MRVLRNGARSAAPGTLKGCSLVRALALFGAAIGLDGFVTMSGSAVGAGPRASIGGDGISVLASSWGVGTS